MNEQFSDGLICLHIASNINGSDANSIILPYEGLLLRPGFTEL